MRSKTTSTRWRALTALALAGTLVACGSGEPATGGEAGPDAARSSSGTSARADGPADPARLAARGEDLFRTRGCNACHAIGSGRLVGPDLAGVTERRDRAWIEAMIVNPDSMLRNDPEAKKLLSEYYTPMQSVGVTAAEAEALYHYLRRETEAASAEAE